MTALVIGFGVEVGGRPTLKSEPDLARVRSDRGIDPANDPSTEVPSCRR